jgi:alginate O-acetyltransferase complex protein AlgI
MSLSGPLFYIFVTLVWLAVRAMHGNTLKAIGLLGASYLFYATFGVKSLCCLVLCSLGNYALGALLRRNPSATLLTVCAFLNCVLLAAFKFLPERAGSHVGALPVLIHPVGISFWTFQSLSYLFDIYRGEELDPSLLEFCLYLSFWPTVLSGPITRLGDMLPQFRKIPRAGFDDLAAGVRLVVLGLFMKVVLAQLMAAGIRQGEGVDFGFDAASPIWGGLDTWSLAVGYGMQLYFDFAGYSYLVIGVARLFGIKVPDNFDRPYVASDPSSFWTKWHMSLSFWIRDYVFLNLARLRQSTAWLYVCLVISMAIFGIWHGATWNYVVWGIYSGLILVIHRLIQRARRGERTNSWYRQALGWSTTFAFISLGWVIFRSHDMRQAGRMLFSVLSPHSYLHLSLPYDYYLLTFVVTAGYFLQAIFRAMVSRQPRVARLNAILVPMYYAIAIVSITVFSAKQSPFVYFRF